MFGRNLGVQEVSSSKPHMDVVRSSTSSSLCMCAFSSRQFFCRSGGLKRCGIRNLRSSLSLRRKLGGAFLPHRELALRFNSGRGCWAVVNSHDTRNPIAEQDESNRDDGDVQRQDAVQEDTNEPAVEVEHGDGSFPADSTSEAPWVKLRNRFVGTLGQLKDQQMLYRKDVDYWGLGTKPIFTVYQGANDRVTRVEINRDEVLRRSGLEPLLPQLDDADSRAEADLKLARAQVLAREIEAGIRDPPVGSTIFDFRKDEQAVGKKLGVAGASAGRGGLMFLIGEAGKAVQKTPPWVKHTIFGVMFVYLFFLVWGARVLVSEELEKEKQQKDQKEREERLLKMRESMPETETNGTFIRQEEAKSSIHSGFGSVQVGKDIGAFQKLRPDIDKDEFRRRVEHIQEMARQVRLSEKERSESTSENDGLGVELVEENAGGVDDGMESSQIAAGNSENSGSRWPSSDKLDTVNDGASAVSKSRSGNPQDFDGHTLSKDKLKILANRLHDVHRLGADTWGKSSTANSALTSPIDSGPAIVTLKHVTGAVAEEDTVSYVEEAVPADSWAAEGEEAKLKSDTQAANGALSRASHDIHHGNSGIGVTELQTEGEELAAFGNTGDTPNANKHRSSARVNGKVGGLHGISRGSRPKVIISVEEARARIAAKKAKRGELNPPGQSVSNSDSGDQHKAAADSIKSSTSAASGVSLSGKGVDIKQASSGQRQAKIKRSPDGDAVGAQEVEALQDTPLDDTSRHREAGNQAVRPSSTEEREDSGRINRISRLNSLMESVVDDLFKMTERLQASEPTEDSSAPVSAEQKEAVAQSDQGDAEQADKEGTSGLSNEEKEELKWMRDDVLREIVFKVQANEQAGRDPFEGLNSEDETRFFKGLERKFEREGDVVKRWIEERVENLDYGLKGPIGVDDPPEKYQLRWKGPPPKRSEFAKKFREDRLRILKETREREGLATPSDDEETDDDSGDDESSGDARSSSSVSNSQAEAKSQQPEEPSMKSTSAATRTVVTAAGKPKEVEQHQFEHTKKWSRELRRKYELERDPETKSLMKEIGQDLDRWISEEEILQAESLLSQGPEGASEYVKLAYEKTKEKIRQQRERFGPEAMVAKYREYKPPKENELWWLDLPFVVCIVMQRVTDGETEEGIFSLDLSAGLEGTGKVMKTPHTVAFQDRTEATQFLYMMRSQSDPDLASVELVPMIPKDLYKDAKADGYNVLVLRKGQLKLTPGQAFEEVEKRIVEIGCSKYYDEMLRERSIDINAVLEDGLGYGRSSM